MVRSILVICQSIARFHGNRFDRTLEEQLQMSFVPHLTRRMCLSTQRPVLHMVTEPCDLSVNSLIH